MATKAKHRPLTPDPRPSTAKRSLKKKLLITSCVIVTALVTFLYYLSQSRFRGGAGTSPLDSPQSPNLAAAGAKTTPAQPSDVRFVEVTSQAGVTFAHYNGAKGEKYLIETMGSGAAFLDYNNDGYLDIYVVNGADLSDKGTSPGNVLYRNNGDGTFTNVTKQAGVRGNGHYGMGVCVADYDNDGNQDIYITNFGPNVLYRNNGDGTFTDVTKRAGVGDDRWGSSCAFADYDNDGNLDLYVANYLDFTLTKKNIWCGRHEEGFRTYCHPDNFNGVASVLYRNNGNGTFTDVTAAARVFNPAGKGLGVVFGDYDNDGYVDLYVANDSIANFLYHNNGDGTFTEVGVLSGVAYNGEGKAEAGMGVDFADYDNDGLLDIFKTNFDFETNTLYRNQGSGFFIDVTDLAGLGEDREPYMGWGTKLLDYDNDGNKDLFIANGHLQDNIHLYNDVTTYEQSNQLFHNEGQGRFTEVTLSSGPGLLIKRVGRGAAFGDYDNDGDTDIFIVNNNQTATLLRNDGGNRNHWLMVKTVGTKSNRDGIGARIKVVVGALTQIAEVRSGSSYLSQNDLRPLFGLGSHTKVDQVEVRWPSGIVETFKDVAANQLLILTEQKGAKGQPLH
jgi:hypothetical protein